eukprot:c12612_g1_i3.p1 GENE.c12612_g1_i3~~c12612_g1_i3.p1  ORF type:complete len:256 (-),score=55.48 c12612_g1_i3:75-842(-)
MEHVTLVVNLDLPKFADTYFHRVGRTGRYGSVGTAVTIITDFEVIQFTQIVNSHLTIDPQDSATANPDVVMDQQISSTSLPWFVHELTLSQPAVPPQVDPPQQPAVSPSQHSTPASEALLHDASPQPTSSANHENPNLTISRQTKRKQDKHDKQCKHDKRDKHASQTNPISHSTPQHLDSNLSPPPSQTLLTPSFVDPQLRLSPPRQETTTQAQLYPNSDYYPPNSFTPPPAMFTTYTQLLVKWRTDYSSWYWSQ